MDVKDRENISFEDGSYTVLVPGMTTLELRNGQKASHPNHWWTSGSAEDEAGN